MSCNISLFVLHRWYFQVQDHLHCKQSVYNDPLISYFLFLSNVLAAYASFLWEVDEDDDDDDEDFAHNDHIQVLFQKRN